MNKCRIVYKQDKSVSIIYPAPNSRRKDETEEQWLERVFAKAMSPQYNSKGEQINSFVGLPYDDINVSELPQSREDRNAWEGEKGKGVKINQVKADTLREKASNDVKIKNKIQELAIKDLKKTGELPEDY